MNEVDYPLWDDEIDKAIKQIDLVTSQIKDVQKKLSTNDIKYNDKNFKIFFTNVCRTMSYWTGHTYVGQKKDKLIQKAYQKFFMTLYEFLLFCRQEDHGLLNRLREFANDALYQGTVYRYLGHSSVREDNNKRIEPEYSDIYVSWSKKPDNQYIQSKLYGTMTLLTCEIDKTFYGIDLETFGVSKGVEAEVVFPTLKEMITSIQYIE